MSQVSQKDWTFAELARRASATLGTSAAFVAACVLVLTWAVTGPLFGYSDAWQLVINTGTTIVTFLMVFLIQSTQNRDARALHLKLDELLRSLKTARNRLIDLENCTDEEIAQIERQFHALKDRESRQNGSNVGTSQAGAHGKVKN
jgi:low affinity Fe/Cu permease